MIILASIIAGILVLLVMTVLFLNMTVANGLINGFFFYVILLWLIEPSFSNPLRLGFTPLL